MESYDKFWELIDDLAKSVRKPVHCKETKTSVSGLCFHKQHLLKQLEILKKAHSENAFVVTKISTING